MSFRNFFPIKRSLYERLFSQDVENRHSIDEIIVHPTQSNHDSPASSNSNHHNFYKIENLIDFFETSNSKSLLKDTRKVLIQKFETSTKPSALELVKLSQKCLGNSIVILLSLEERKKFHLYWKSKQIKHFLTLKIYEIDFMNDIRLFEFLADFLANSMVRGHLGLHSKVPIKPALNTIEFHFLADHRNYNLLLVAADVGNAHVVKIMLELGFSSDFPEINAQTLAWKNHHFEVLSLLLKSNLIYPYSINIDECPEDIQKFYEASRELNEAILAMDRDKVLRIITPNKSMTHFYNLNNESALAFALNRRLFDMYRLLISKNIMLGPHENFSEIKDNMKEKEREKLREIHFKESKTLPDNHMHILLSNSRLGHDSINVQEKFQKIQNAFEILNGNPFIQIILKIVAASRNFRIIFDFNRDSVEVVDPTVDDSTEGLFYISFGRIYIAAKKLLNDNTKFEALGTIAHELCHYTMTLVYRNYAKPYFVNDSKTKKLFEEIFNFCVENAGIEKLIDIIHECYHESMYHAELIVRVPHLIMIFLNKPEKFNAVRSTFHSLFDVFENKVFKEMKEALPRIEAKAEAEKEKNRKRLKRLKLIYVLSLLLCLILAIFGIWGTAWYFYKPTYKFSEMSRQDQIKVENAPVLYKHVDITFHDLFPQKSYVYDILTSDDISQMLKKDPLDFSSPHLFYLNDLVIFEWKNLTTKLKDKFLLSNFTFQNETVTFKNMSLSTSDAFDSFQSKEIISVLDGKLIFVHKMISNNSAFYTERSMFTEYIYPIYYLFMNKLNKDKTQYECVYKNTTGTASDKFETFYANFTNLEFKEIINKTNNIVQLDDYLRCLSLNFRILDPKTEKIVDSLLNHKSFQKGFDEILIESGLEPNLNSSRIFILSADAGTGKTETFRQFALRIKRKYPTRWVSYIDYRKKSFIADKIETLDNVRTALEKILEVNQTSEFEKKIFKECFDSGKMILLWDGYDQINLNTSWYPNIAKILKLLYSQKEKKYIQFVSTRPFFSNGLRTNFSIEPYTFVPLDEDSRNNFLYGLFSSQNITESQIIVNIDKVYRIINSTKSKYDFNTPMPLQMIANVILTSDNQTSENLYQLYQRIVKNKLHSWLNNINGGRKLIESLLINQMSALEIYQKFAFRMIPSNRIGSYYRFLALNLMISMNRLSKNINVFEISEMGILYINSNSIYTFAHPTFMEFFIAQYIIQNVFQSKGDILNHEAELRIQLFFWSIQDSGISIFIESFLRTVNTISKSNFDQLFESLFSSQYQNFTLKVLQNCPTLIPFLIRFFEKDHKVLTQQLLISSSDGIYRATYDFAYFNKFAQDPINRSDIRNTAKTNLAIDEYENFVSLKDHKGIILYSMYCIKQYYNSSEYARQLFPEYDLSNEIFDNNNVSEVLKLIAKNLTLNELKKLLTSETVWHMQSIFNNTDEFVINSRNSELIFYKTLLNLVEKDLTKDEQKIWISNFFKFIFLLEDETTRDFLLTKVKKIYSEIEMVNLFSNSKILHLTASLVNSLTFFKRFNTSWNFFVANTKKKNHKPMLQGSENVECYLNQKYSNLCYLVPKINLLQSSLLGGFSNTANNSSMFFQYMLKLYYDNNFNNTDLQELIITGSKEFVPFLIMVGNSDNCQTYAEFLKDLFKDNRSALVNFISKSDKTTKFSVYGLIQMNHFSPENFKIFENIVL